MITNKTKYSALLLAVVIISFILIFKPNKDTPDNCNELVSLLQSQNPPVATSQVVVVKSLGGFKAEITACQYHDKQWIRVLMPTFPGVIGKEGIALVGEKKEGDRKTPIGLYPFGEVFGTEAMALKMDYKYITRDDKFVDDVMSKDYNRWVIGKTDAKSYEAMLIEPYNMGAVINYNMNPTIAGAGSAIFMHLWRAANAPTWGCIAMDEQHLSAILHWLDKRQHPYIYITR
ncbi:MAG: L,D-transpeptidase family protein [Legionella sp.]|nr:L,D-transpeptidase family protein [Legionella sp.]